jgi:hypothetical protein
VRVSLDNSSVSNNELIREDPARVTRAVESVVPLALGMVGGAIPTISINDLLAGAALPIGINLADDAIRLVESDGERFLGVFVDLETPSPTPFTQRIDTEVELVTVNVPDSSIFHIDTLGVGERPSIEIAINAAGPDGVEYEYQHRVDGQIWSEWTRSPYAVISHDSFLLQGRHSVDARARVVGGTGSTDLTPARAEFLIDVLSPQVETVSTVDGTVLRAADAVSYAEELSSSATVSWAPPSGPAGPRSAPRSAWWPTQMASSSSRFVTRPATSAATPSRFAASRRPAMVVAAATAPRARTTRVVRSTACSRCWPWA